ncbi:hypothetical protein IEU95_05875 [Hoyosella rhizosphaerae]|uniref:Carboxypeptidase regulatory-like domain-containing protein n=1 Tax=Hoyosella rhizosphaerae TaxID=1755582 RepID=A0A916U4K5_9ACTN|nr:hypothetical protein [Hoyosella rhizosphaerae]MBN4926350.1 hypothetical protein [Hoyosella rhizosphaerae]GGC60047.1 hypothetical protein GCM10011410_10640 [Hoyosella rhizosphaerae]
MRVRTYRASAAVLACAALLLSACNDTTDSTSAALENSATPTENVIAPDADDTAADDADSPAAPDTEKTAPASTAPQSNPSKTAPTAATKPASATPASTEQQRGGYFSIQAHTPTFDPVPGVTFAVKETCPRDLPNGDSSNPAELGRGTTGADGTVSIPVPVGCFAVTLESHPAEFTPEPYGLAHGVVTAPDDVALIRIAFRHTEERTTGTARFTVVSDVNGAPRPDTAVTLAPCGSTAAHTTTGFSDANGAVSIDLPAGCWNVTGVAEPHSADQLVNPAVFNISTGEVHIEKLTVKSFSTP